jgi:two-component system, OmpR family, sensor kinase
VAWATAFAAEGRKVLRSFLSSLRGRILLTQLVLFALVLIGLGVYQSSVLSDYLHDNAVDSITQPARAELEVLGPCFVNSRADLHRNGQVLAQLLGARNTAVKIVDRRGAALADHAIGVPGKATPLELSAATLDKLIASVPPPRRRGGSAAGQAGCTPGSARAARTQPPAIATTTADDFVLVAVALGPPDERVGYAILGRPLSGVEATVDRVRTIFAVGALAALILSGLASLVLTGLALRPLRRMTKTAEEIAAGELHRRTHVRSRDEVGRLASAFDQMIGRLQEAFARVTESEQRMRRFLADASHELRTPLTALRGTSQVLLRRSDQSRPEVAEAARDIHEEAIRLSRLVDDLLTLNRLDAAEALRPEEISMAAFMDEFVDRYAEAWPTRRVDFDRAAFDGARAWVDPEALRRMLLNVVDNAAKYSSAPSPIAVTAEAGPESVVIRVTDEGPGLSAEDRERVFDRFYRGSESRSRRTGGSGLGLSIVQALAERSAGSVSLESEPGRGTTVTITLPASKSAPG